MACLVCSDCAMRLYTKRWAKTVEGSRVKSEEPQGDMRFALVAPRSVFPNGVWAPTTLERTELFHQLLHIHVRLSQYSCSLSAEVGDKPITSEQTLAVFKIGSLCRPSCVSDPSLPQCDIHESGDQLEQIITLLFSCLCFSILDELVRLIRM